MMGKRKTQPLSHLPRFTLLVRQKCHNSTARTKSMDIIMSGESRRDREVKE